MQCTLLDISRGMLDRAVRRVSEKTGCAAQALYGDIRDLSLPEETFDVAVSGTALHHLRTDTEWKQVFQKVFNALKPGGGFWISDLVRHDHPEIERLMKARYGAYLEKAGGVELRNRVFESIAEEDTPQTVEYQISLLQETGFTDVTVLHKHACFAAFGGRKPAA